jgi:hypothetical protein
MMVNNIKSLIIRTAAVQDSACKGKQILVDPPSPDACCVAGPIYCCQPNNNMKQEQELLLLCENLLFTSCELPQIKEKDIGISYWCIHLPLTHADPPML